MAYRRDTPFVLQKIFSARGGTESMGHNGKDENIIFEAFVICVILIMGSRIRDNLRHEEPNTRKHTRICVN